MLLILYYCNFVLNFGLHSDFYTNARRPICSVSPSRRRRWSHHRIQQQKLTMQSLARRVSCWFPQGSYHNSLYHVAPMLEYLRLAMPVHASSNRRRIPFTFGLMQLNVGWGLEAVVSDRSRLDVFRSARMYLGECSFHVHHRQRLRSWLP